MFTAQIPLTGFNREIFQSLIQYLMALANLLSVCWVVRQEGGHMEHYLLVFVDRVHTLFASLSILAIQSTTISDNETIVRIILNVHN